MATFRRISISHEGPALLLRSVPYGDADAVVTLFVEPLGRVSAMARGVRRPAHKRARLELEPMHTLTVQLGERTSGELLVLKQSKYLKIRSRLVREWNRLDAAGHALRWLRVLAPQHQAEPLLWTEITDFLDALNSDPLAIPPHSLLAATGLRMLAALGYSMELQGCVRCGKACPADQASLLDPQQGGLVCRACGGGPYLVAAHLRKTMIHLQDGGSAVITEEESTDVIGWVEQALRAHATLVLPPQPYDRILWFQACIRTVFCRVVPTRDSYISQFHQVEPW
jgi:DNA repair protein RecO (recombination protein O)